MEGKLDVEKVGEAEELVEVEVVELVVMEEELLLLVVEVAENIEENDAIPIIRTKKACRESLFK